MDNNDKELISQERLCSLIGEWILPKIYRIGGALFNNIYASIVHLYLDVSGENRTRQGGLRLCNDHWDIFNFIYKKEYVNIKIFNDHIEFINDSMFVDTELSEDTDYCCFPKEEMYSMYEYLNERIFGNKEETKKEEKVKNNKLISQEELCSLVGELMLPKIARIGGVFLYKPEFGIDWILADSAGRWNRRRGARLHNKEYWEIYNEWDKFGNVNIEIHDDHIVFDEYSNFIDFSRDEMYSLYEYFNEKIFGIKENKEENVNG